MKRQPTLPIRHLILALLAVPWLVPDPAALAQQEAGWELLTEQLEPSPLPYQPAIVRRTVRNHSAAFGVEDVATRGMLVVGVKPPGADAYRPVQGNVLRNGREISTDNPLSRTNSVWPLSAEPGYELSLVHTLAGDWTAQDEVAPLFTDPGRYLLQLQRRGETIEIDVQPPTGDDKEIAYQLRANAPLATVMLSPTLVPGEDLLKPLQRLVRLYGGSSYAHYARFALARHYAPAETVQEMRELSQDQRIAAMSYLGEIRNDPFAYAAHALILQLKIDESFGEDEGVYWTAARLRRRYPDSYAYLSYLAERFQGVEWVLLNPRAPRKIGTPIIDEGAGIILQP